MKHEDSLKWFAEFLKHHNYVPVKDKQFTNGSKKLQTKKINEFVTLGMECQNMMATTNQNANLLLGSNYYQGPT